MPTWSDLTRWWQALTSDPERLALLAVLVVVAFVLLRVLLRSCLGRVVLVVMALVVVAALARR
jgi:hypothetical protein